MAMSRELSTMLEIVEDVKEKLTDQEYKDLMDAMMAIHRMRPQPHQASASTCSIVAKSCSIPPWPRLHFVFTGNSHWMHTPGYEPVMLTSSPRFVVKKERMIGGTTVSSGKPTCTTHQSARCLKKSPGVRSAACAPFMRPPLDGTSTLDCMTRSPTPTPAAA